MITIDMHVHSIFSDGTFTPEEIVKTAKKRRLSFITLTDHDTTSGLSSFMSACHKNKIEGLCGIELSAEADYTLHILGFRINPVSAKLNNTLSEIRENRNQRNIAICEKLSKLGIHIDLSEVTAVSNGEVVARPHIANLMLKKRYVNDRKEAFSKYLGRGGAAYVPRKRLSAAECIELITDAGGVAVLAHPYQTGLDDDKMRVLLKRLKDYGLWGIEAVYSAHSPEQIFNCLRLADEFSLYPTAGSDFHGANTQGTPLGMVVSHDFLPWARLGLKI